MPVRVTHEQYRAAIDAALAHTGDECLPWPYRDSANGVPVARLKRSEKYGKLPARNVSKAVAACSAREYSVASVILVDITGERPAGFVPGFTCGNRRCTNPQHLFWVRYNRHSVKLTNAQARAIHADPRKRKVIAADYAITVAHVDKIKHGKARLYLELGRAPRRQKK